MKKLFRLLVGYTEFEIEGSGIERFMSLMLRKKIRLMDIKKIGNSFSASVWSYNYNEVKSMCSKSGNTIKKEKKRGLIQYITEHKHRMGIIIGLLLFALIYYFLSLHIWDISVSGNVKISEEQILLAAEEAGLFSGAFKDSFEPSLVSKEIMKKIPLISWISVNTRGSSISISIKEKSEMPQIINKDEAADVISLASGQIIDMQVFSGQPLVKKGDAVYKGQLLVSGTSVSEEGESEVVRADAIIKAKTRRSYEVKVNEKESYKEETGKILTKYSLKLLGIQFPLSYLSNPEGEYIKDISHVPFAVGKISLPFEIIKESWIEVKENKKILNEQEARIRAEMKIEAIEKTELSNIEIKSRQTYFKYENGEYIMYVHYECIENIAFVRSLSE